MGSRISINLSEFLFNEYAELRLTNHRVVTDPDSDEDEESVESYARVTFQVHGPKSVEYVFNVYSHAEIVTLSRDFNYFRYEEGSDEQLLLRHLYEAGINFTVTH
jgi:hypothetical protein